MKVVLWIFQVILAVLFLGHGWLFVAPPADLVATMNAQISPAFRIFIGVTELLGAVGLILPGVTRILPWLTVFAAAGLMIVVGSATLFHLFRGEIGEAAVAAVLFILLTMVAYMRWKVKPLAARSRIGPSLGRRRV